MSRYIQAFFSAIFLLSLVLSANAQTAVDASGHWEGLITWEGSDKVPKGETTVQVDLMKDGRSQLVGEISIPGHKLLGRPLVNINALGQSVTFQIALSSPGDNTFKGVLAAGGQSMSGDLIFQGTPLPFTLTRMGDSRMQPPSPGTPIAKELEGAWSGTLTLGEKSLRLALTLNNQGEGPAKGVMITLDQGNLEIPITTITQKGATLTLDLKAAGGSFLGTVNPENTEISGTWTQGTLVVPLTFKHGPR